MAIIVEDGTGRADAEAYLSVAEFDAHCAVWGYDLTGKTIPQKEIALRQAAAFIDIFGRYKSTRLRAQQSLEFPRAGMLDWSGHPVEGIPPRVKRAAAELAFKALSENILADLDRGGRVQSESVGPVSVSYAADAPAGKTYKLAQGLLEPYLRADTLDLRGPAWAPPGERLFGIGVHDDPPTVPGGEP